MKHIILIISLLILSAGMLSAQSTVGLRGGINLANFSGDDVSANSDNKPGVNAGVIIQIVLSESFLLQPEVLYSQRGAQSKTTIAGIETESYTYLNYAELPIMFKYNFDLNGLLLQPYIGPDLRYLIDAKQKTKVSVGSSSSTSNTDLEDINAIDYGFNAGLDLVIGRNLVLGARYSLGLRNIEEKDSSNDTIPDMKNSGLMFSLGILF